MSELPEPGAFATRSQDRKAVNLCGILSTLFPLRAPFVLLHFAANSVFCFGGLSKCCEPDVWCLDGHWQIQIPSCVEAFARLAASQILNIDGIGIRRKSADQPGSYDLLIGIMGSYRRRDRLLVIRLPISQLARQPCASGRQDCLGFSSNAASLELGGRPNIYN